MASNIFVFFVAGFETTASTMAYCLLELAANPYVQDKMRQEILDTLAEHDGKITYDDLKNLRYVDQVISGKNCITCVETVSHFFKRDFSIEQCYL